MTEKEKLESNDQSDPYSGPHNNPYYNPPKEPEGSDKTLFFGIIVVILVFASIIIFVSLGKEEPKTVEELHLLNLRNKLNPDRGYVYKNAYSFINLEGFWFTQLQNPSGKTIYDLSMRYGPRELENITIFGWLNTTYFDNKENYYVTFNPNGNDFSKVALAVADFNSHMINAFKKYPIPACDKNETPECISRPLITCDNTEEIVLYVNESEKFGVYYKDNCILINGKGMDLVRGVDRVLYNFYDIMEQRE